MQSYLNTIGLVLLIGMNVGCMTFGKQFQSNVEWIKKGETTQKDAYLVLGEPQEVGSSGGVPTWTYYFYRYKILGKDSRKEVKFYWDKDKTVSHFSFSTSFKKDLQGTVNSMKNSKN